jgi:hypothetical protein
VSYDERGEVVAVVVVVVVVDGSAQVGGLYRRSKAGKPLAPTPYSYWGITCAAYKGDKSLFFLSTLCSRFYWNKELN